MAQPVIAVVGCGAISELSYMPALAADAGWRPATWLVEPNVPRALALAAHFGFRRDQVVPSAEQLPSTVTLAINATPSHLHLPTTMALIDKGISVLVEKPFAENGPDAVAMMQAAAGRCILSVNQSRRAGPSNALVHELLRTGRLGTITRISWHEGHKFDWPSQSGFNFRRPWQGRPRGALLDIGIHVLDLICWWFDGAPKVLSASMDGNGGPEASVKATLALDDAVIDLRLSYLAKLSNTFVIEGTGGAIRGSTADYARIELKIGAGPWRSVKAKGSTDSVAAAAHLVRNVLGAVAGRETLKIDAASTLPALLCIDELYAKADVLLSACYRGFGRGDVLAADSRDVERVA